MGEPMPTIFYRLVATDPPSLVDFLSKEARGEPLRDDTAETRRLWQGVSVYATEAQAQRKGRTSPVLGRFVAEIELPADSPIRWERTTTSSGHHTLWGDPATLLACVTRVVAVSRWRGS